jgi:hypothetical protein
VRNEEECVCSVCQFRCNIFIGVRIIKKIPGSVGGGTPYIFTIGARIWMSVGCRTFRVDSEVY